MSGHHSHDHTHTSGGGDGSTPLRGLSGALVVNTVFFVVILVGAFVSNSLTLLAEALHMLTDSASLVLALFAAWIAAKPADSSRTYGYNRAEVLAGLLNGAALAGVAGYVLYDAYSRVQNPTYVDPEIMILIGVVGVVANVVAAAFLFGDRNNLNVEGAFLHLAVDAASSVAVVAGGLLIHVTEFQLIDPILAVGIALVVLYSVSDLLRDSLNILLQGSPDGIDVDEVTTTLEQIEGVVSTHHVHVWALDSNTTAVSAHVVVDRESSTTGVLRVCQTDLDEQFGFDHITIQPEHSEFSESLDIECY